MREWWDPLISLFLSFLPSVSAWIIPEYWDWLTHICCKKFANESLFHLSEPDETKLRLKLLIGDRNCLQKVLCWITNWKLSVGGSAPSPPQPMSTWCAGQSSQGQGEVLARPDLTLSSSHLQLSQVKNTNTGVRWQSYWTLYIPISACGPVGMISYFPRSPGATRRSRNWLCEGPWLCGPASPQQLCCACTGHHRQPLSGLLALVA